MTAAKLVMQNALGFSLDKLIAELVMDAIDQMSGTDGEHEGHAPAWLVRAELEDDALSITIELVEADGIKLVGANGDTSQSIENDPGFTWCIVCAQTALGPGLVRLDRLGTTSQMFASDEDEVERGDQPERHPNRLRWRWPGWLKESLDAAARLERSAHAGPLDDGHTKGEERAARRARRAVAPPRPQS